MAHLIWNLFIDECLSPQLAIKVNAGEARGEPARLMVNHVLELSEAGVCTLYALPAY